MLNLALIQSAGNGVTNINFNTFKSNEIIERNLMLTFWQLWLEWGMVGGAFRWLKGLICLEEFNIMQVNIHYINVCLVRGGSYLDGSHDFQYYEVSEDEVCVQLFEVTDSMIFFISLMICFGALIRVSSGYALRL